jgi:hypothetical protein
MREHNQRDAVSPVGPNDIKVSQVLGGSALSVPVCSDAGGWYSSMLVGLTLN